MSNAKFESNRQRILRVQLFIESNLDKELPLERLAEVAFLSPYHFHRIFRATVGEGVAEYVRRVRLERAAMTLKATEKPVTSVAFDAGYGSHEAFTRAFRKRFGVSPSEFRNGHTVNFENKKETIVTSDTQSREIRIDQFPDKRVAFMRHTGPYHESGATFQKIMGWAFSRGLFGPQTQVLSLCHDDPEVTPSDKLRLDCCITVDDSFESSEDVTTQIIPGGEYVVLTHRGSYTGLAESYCWLYGEWLSTSGREFADRPPFEVYVNNPSETPEEELLTEICIMLKPAL